MRQYYTRSGKRVLRVQQSLTTLDYRVVSIAPGKIKTSFASDAARPSWASSYRCYNKAQEELDNYAKEHDLKAVHI